MGSYAGLFIVFLLVDMARRDKTFLALFWIPLGWIFPIAFQYALDAVTCNGDGKLIKDPAVTCQVGSSVTVIGVFSVFFIISGLLFKAYKAYHHERNESKLFYGLDVIRSCMTAVSNTSPTTGSGIILSLSIFQAILCLGFTFVLARKSDDTSGQPAAPPQSPSVRTRMRKNPLSVQSTRAQAVVVLASNFSPIALHLNPLLAYIILLNFIIEIVLVRVSRYGPYDYTGSAVLGYTLICLVLVSFLWGGYDFLKFSLEHKSEVTICEADIEAEQFSTSNPFSEEGFGTLRMLPQELLRAEDEEAEN